MILYLLKSSLCLLLLLTAYRTLLEKEKMHRFNRAYLLFSLLFSFIIPLIPMVAYVLPAKLPSNLPGLPAGISRLMAATAPAITSTPIHPTSVRTIIGMVYCAVTVGFIIRFIRNLYRIRLRIMANRSIRLAESRLVLVPEKVVIHTFYKTIFMNEAAYAADGIEREILRHELTHVRQLHTLDILLVEALQVFFWFNPLLKLYKRAIQLNHEFLADEAVIQAYQNPREYQHLLLNKISSMNQLSFSSPLNYNITKKRLVMMTATYHPKSIFIKQLAIVALLLGALFLFSSKLDAQQPGSEKVTNLEGVLIGMDNLGQHPFVQIDGKDYPSDIVMKISPSCIRSASVFQNKSAVQKYGPKAADGAVIIKTIQGISYITATERDNLVKQQEVKAGFYHRVTLRKEDGTEFDKLFINIPQVGSVNASGRKGCKVGFLVGNRLFTEDQIDEVETLLKEIPKPLKVSVGGSPNKQIPGLDLSSYEMIFNFDPSTSADAVPKDTSTPGSIK